MEKVELSKMIVENGMMYRMAEDGCYYLDLSLEQETDYPIGKYGIIRGEYMMEYQRGQYLEMIMDGTWNEYLHRVDEECHREVTLAVKRMMEKERVMEELKAEKPLEWIRSVNGIRDRVEKEMEIYLLSNKKV